MNWPAAIANSLWVGSSLPSYAKFQRALRHPDQAQRGLLLSLLAKNADCAYGRAHSFGAIRSYEEFARRVPLVDYDDLDLWIHRIRWGESRVLTCEKVTHLIPTSGSTGGRKLIPFTAGLQSELSAAIGPWIADLAHQHPGILLGPAYWSISPSAMEPDKIEPSAIPIGFADDASYLGGMKSRLVRAAMIAPNEPYHITGLDDFRYQTLLCLLRQRDLRLISIWHPSFLTLLLDALPRYWGKLLAEIYQNQSGRARELEVTGPGQPEMLWPHLRVISCWGDGHAKLALSDLQRRFSRTHIQSKGLLATEAFVTIPFAGRHPVAVRSHFFEFLNSAGQIRLVHELREGETYQVIVTTAAGLWRYKLGDEVQVNSIAGSTPSLRFVGRTGNTCDICGEKLSESFVSAAIGNVMASMLAAPHFVMLAPESCAGGWRYVLFAEGEVDATMASERLELELCTNPNYALCRRLGQLQPLRVFHIARHGHEAFLNREVAAGNRIGNVKTSFLSRRSDWATIFIGEHAPGRGEAETDATSVSELQLDGNSKSTR